MNKFVGKISILEIIIWFFLILVLGFTVLPIVFMLSASFMDAKQILAMHFSWIPSKAFFTSPYRIFSTNFY